MYSLVSGVYSAYLAPQKLNILVVGAQGSGKTTIMERLKVTHFQHRQRPIVEPAVTALPVNVFQPQTSESMSSPQSPTQAPRASKITTAKLPSMSPGTTRQRLAWVCPAPPKYTNAMVDEEEEDEEYTEPYRDVPPPTQKPLTKRSSTGEASMQSVELNDKQDATAPPPPPPPPFSSEPSSPPPQQQQHDLKPKSKMLSLDKIRPTIGMNLGKVDICGAKCHIWDLGGRLQDLWERYYDDCDAVVFVWKIPAPQEPVSNGDDDDDSDCPPPVTFEQQHHMLQQVRNAIADDVPILVLVHYFSAQLPVPARQRYSTAPYLLPHYHNHFQSVFVVNAASGEGVKAAMEWLIPLAKQLQRVRDRPTEGADDDDLVKPL